jgi:hypothetical protein
MDLYPGHHTVGSLFQEPIAKKPAYERMRDSELMYSNNKASGADYITHTIR